MAMLASVDIPFFVTDVRIPKEREVLDNDRQSSPEIDTLDGLIMARSTAFDILV